MNDSLFEALYRQHYQRLPRSLYLLPLLLVIVFIGSLGALAFTRTDKVIEAEGVILPRQIATTVLTRRGFVLEQHVLLGRSVKRGQLLAIVQLDDGSVSNYLALQDGVIVDTALKPVAEGPIPEATLIATIADPQALRLQVELPARWRGSVKIGAVARYRFDSLTQSQRSRVGNSEIRLQTPPRGGDDGIQAMHYLLYVELAAAHRDLAYLGRKVPVKLLIERVSLLDYFLNG
jgi:hypothetical protein